MYEHCIMGEPDYQDPTTSCVSSDGKGDTPLRLGCLLT